MNINSNELLLLNKKIKFAGEEPNNTSVISEIEIPAENGIQTGMNTLMYKGYNNLMSNPQLAANVGYMQDAENPKDDNAENYVAPYQSNIAFQGKFGNKSKSVMTAIALGAAAMLGLSSCDDKEYIPIYPQETKPTTVIINNNIDMTALTSLMANFYAAIDKLIEEQRLTREEAAQQRKEAQEFYTQMLLLMNKQIANSDALLENNAAMYNLLASYIVTSTTNQELTISMLTSMGMDLKEAKELLKNLSEAFTKNDIEAIKKYLDQILSKLVSIESLIKQGLDDFHKYAQQMLAKQNILIATQQIGFNELIKQGKITNATLQDMKEQNAELIEIGKQQVEAQQKIEDAIKSSIDNMNAGFDTVVATLNINKEELIAVLQDLGYSTQEIMNMNAKQIVDAIHWNTAIIQGQTMMLGIISSQLSVLPQMLEQQKITNQQIEQLNTNFNNFQESWNEYKGDSDKFFKDAIGLLIGSNNLQINQSINQQVIIQMLMQGNRTEAEAKDILQKLLKEVTNGNKTEQDLLKDIYELTSDMNGTLNDINDTLKAFYDEFKSFRQDYDKNNKEYAKDMKQLIIQNRIQTAILGNIHNHVSNMDKNIKGIENSINKFEGMVQNNFNDIKDILNNNGATAGMTKAELEEMLNALGITIANAIQMSQSELVRAIENFRKTYIETEKEQTKEMKEINAKLDNLAIWNGEDKTDIINAINGVASAIDAGKDDITAEIKVLENELDKLQKTVDALLKAFLSHAANVDSKLGDFNNKFNEVLGLLPDFLNQLALIDAKLSTANVNLSLLLNEAQKIREDIEKLKQAAGGQLDYDKLADIIKNQSDIDFDRYSALLDKLNIDPSKFDDIADLLAAINNKLDILQDNYGVACEIRNFLKNHDWSNPDYSDKLEEIKQIIIDYACKCQHGESTEGVIGDLNNALN